MKNPRSLWIGLFLSISIYLTTFLFELDLFEKMEVVFRRFERFEIDEIIFPLLVFTVFALIHVFGLVKKSKIEAERAKIYTAMLSSTYQILNDLLDQMQFFKAEAEKVPGFNQKSIPLLDDAIERTKKRMRDLSKISSIDEFSIHESVST